MEKKLDADITNSQVTLLLEVDGHVHMIGVQKDELQAISYLIKKATKVIIPTNKTQAQLNNFLKEK